jgi:hypothetical protein
MRSIGHLYSQGHPIEIRCRLGNLSGGTMGGHEACSMPQALWEALHSVSMWYILNSDAGCLETQTVCYES